MGRIADGNDIDPTPHLSAAESLFKRLRRIII
jgi:hypothetical protein